MMFRFLELSLHGWALWPNLKLRLDRDVVLLTGPNGSGKTTILDAIRQLLNAQKLSSKRRLQDYLRLRPDAPALIRAVVSNESAGNGARAFRHEKILTPEATLACALVPSSSGSPEKRFAILEGRPTIEELRVALIESKGYYSPERYSRALEAAGLTRSLVSVLAIDQGKMNTHFELKPRDLFIRVLEMLGDRSVIDRYNEARRRYEESRQEALRQADTLKNLQLRLNQVHRQVQEREKWEEASEKVGRLESHLPASEFQGVWHSREELAPKIQEFRTKVQRGEGEEARRVEVVAASAKTCRKEEEELAKAATAEQAASEVVVSARTQFSLAKRLVTDLENDDRSASKLTVGELRVLEIEADGARNAMAVLTLSRENAEVRVKSLNQAIESLRAGLPPYPDAVERTIRSLNAQGLRTTLMASLMEPIDNETAESLEAALGPARYSLITNPKDAPQVIKTARENRFPGPIYAGPRLPEGVKAPWLKATQGTPAWIAEWIKTVVLKPEGIWEDVRGTWVERPAERILGKQGLKAALGKAEQDLAQVKQELTKLDEEGMKARARITKAEEELASERERRRLAERAAGLPGARKAAREAGVVEERAGKVHEEARGRQLEAVVASQVAKANLQTATKDLDDQRRLLAGEREALEKMQADAAELDRKMRELEPRVAPELRERAIRKELDSLTTIGDDLARARDHLMSLGEPPGPEVREEYKHLRFNIEEAELHIQSRQREAEDAQRELAECRKRYLEVVDRELVDYKRRAIELGKRADVVVEIELPHLADDDRFIDEAEITAKFGFDGKEILPLGDATFSGGQRVISGIILLMAVAETEGQGFFILDEPFAHLSIDRVDDVARFLKSARSQFILTAPTTLDRNQLDPASLVIVLLKKRPNEKYASHPIVAIS